MKRIFYSLFVASILMAGVPAHSAEITPVGVDIETNDAWRTTDVIKPFEDDDNVYGTDGYLIAQFPNNDPRNLVNPPYATIALAGGNYEGLGAEPHQSAFDDVAITPGPGPIANKVCGDYYKGGGADGNVQEFFTVTLTQSGSFRLGVIGDQTVNIPNNLFWEASKGVQVTGPGGADSGLIYIAGPARPDESWRNGDVDYVLFDITGQVGDVFTVSGENDGRWSDNALGGVFLDRLDTSIFKITSVARDPGTGAVTLTFPTTKGTTYTVEASTDLVEWIELDDSVDGQAVETNFTDTVFAPAPAPGKNRVFYRATRN